MSSLLFSMQSYYNIDTDIFEFIELVNETLSSRFSERWRYKFSERFIKVFQLKVLEAINNQRPIKITTLFNYLHKKCGYDKIQIIEFFESIDIDIYRPLVFGRL